MPYWPGRRAALDAVADRGQQIEPCPACRPPPDELQPERSVFQQLSVSSV
jgi:hypothetical protein